MNKAELDWNLLSTLHPVLFLDASRPFEVHDLVRLCGDLMRMSGAVNYSCAVSFPQR